jgi:hypothetical protein
MPRLVLPLALLAIAAACDSATDPIGTPSSTAAVVAAAKAAPSVDPGSLIPVPAPPTVSECKADGRWIICHTTLLIEPVNDPVGDVGCGTIYETSRDARLGIRWYDASTRVIVKRHVRQDLEGTWTLSPTGAGPAVDIVAHQNWYDSDYTDPNDLDSGLRSTHGEFTAKAPGFGVIAHVAGFDTPDGTHHGAIRDFGDPAIAAKLCAALER